MVKSSQLRLVREQHLLKRMKKVRPVCVDHGQSNEADDEKAGEPTAHVSTSRTVRRYYTPSIICDEFEIGVQAV